MTATYDWSRFTKRINIKAAVDQLYHAWTTRKGIESWFLRTGEFSTTGIPLANDAPVQTGNTYKWHWFGYGDEVVEHGEVIAANGKDFFAFSFGGSMKVQVLIKTEEGENIIELIQYDIPVDEKSKTSFHLGCAEGWVFYLANLKSILEGGVDLRNKNQQIKKMINS